MIFPQRPERASWSRELETTMLQELVSCQRQGLGNPVIFGNFRSTAWDRVGEQLRKQHHVTLSQQQIKSRYNILRDNYKTYIAICSSPDFSFDNATGMLTAPDSVWDSYLLKNHRARVFRYSRPPRHRKLSAQLFVKTVATGSCAPSNRDTLWAASTWSRPATPIPMCDWSALMGRIKNDTGKCKIAESAVTQDDNGDPTFPPLANNHHTSSDDLPPQEQEQSASSRPTVVLLAPTDSVSEVTRAVMTSSATAASRLTPRARKRQRTAYTDPICQSLDRLVTAATQPDQEPALVRATKLLSDLHSSEQLTTDTVMSFIDEMEANSSKAEVLLALSPALRINWIKHMLLQKKSAES